MPPTPPENATPPPPGTARRRRTVLSVVFFALGAAMLGAAIWTIARQGATLEQARASLRDASPWLIVVALLLPLVNWLSTAASIWVLVGRYGRVGGREMAALIGAAWLLNMLPMRPGMLGRVAYHRKINHIRVRDSVRAMVAAIICSGCALAVMLGVVAMGAMGRHTGLLVALLLLPAVLLGAGVVVLRRSRKPGDEHRWRWPAAIGFRYFDMLTWAARYTIVFSLIGHPVGLMGGSAMAAVGQAAMLTPVQLGLREWAVGVASAGLEASQRPPEDLDARKVADATAPGLLADCCMRAAELLVVAPVGLCSTAWVVTRLRAHAKRSPDESEEDASATGDAA